MTFCKISDTTKRIYQKFNEIRGKSKSDIPFRFWDVVVLTASDDDQKLAYEHQLRGKLARKEIPSGLPYLVFSDPSGPKIGCGGATMHVIHQLSKIYGEGLNKLLVLVINAGGQSQRLPSASVLGKIFTALPFGEPPWQLLELKLACYLPFLPRMKSGFFHIASDTIEVFDVGEDESNYEEWNFLCPGLTALAHPSPLKIGTTHGVFVLENKESLDPKLAEFRKCVEVLQKPSIDVMVEKEAVIKNTGSVPTLSDNEEYVYTDSCFFFDHNMAEKLLEFYLEVFPLQCEIDGYGDFMQSLGPKATDVFASDLRNVSKVEPLLIETRKKLFLSLQGTALNVITLEASKFYHLGTMRECLENFDANSDLAYCIGFVSSAYSILQSKHESEVVNNSGCIIHSLITGPCHLGNRSIIEYCEFQSPIVIGDDCLVSNCNFQASESSGSTDIPSGLLLHTIELKSNGAKTRFVTLALHINDNIKKTVSGTQEEALDKIIFLGTPLSRAVTVKNGDLFAKASEYENPALSLWFARIFPVTETKQSSFLATLDLVKSVLGFRFENLEECTPECCISAFEAVQMKDVQKMVYHREQLFDDIMKLKCI